MQERPWTNRLVIGLGPSLDGHDIDQFIATRLPCDALTYALEIRLEVEKDPRGVIAKDSQHLVHDSPFLQGVADVLEAVEISLPLGVIPLPAIGASGLGGKER